MNDRKFMDLVNEISRLDRSNCSIAIDEQMSWGEWLSRWVNMWAAIAHKSAGWTVIQSPGLWFYWYWRRR